jgi:hypothetical protein
MRIHGPMAGKPDGIVLRRHRDMDGRDNHPLVRRGLLALVGAILVLGLFNLFGERPSTSRAATPAAVLSVYAPSHVRGGLLYTARFHVTARSDLQKAILVLDSGWFEGMQVNSIVPQPVQEASRDGRVVFDLGHIAKGSSSIMWIQFQVNPTNLGHRSQNVELDNGPDVISTVHRSITVYP